MQARFLTSAADKKGFLQTEQPVIAVSGRSNVGKSSFINMLANQKKLARASAEPGRTRLVNYFQFDGFVLADLPGYGFARVSAAEKQRWARLLDDFFAQESAIAHVFALVDLRHPPSADDKTMIEFLYARRIPFTVVATKADKLGKTRVKAAVRALAAALSTGEGNVIAVSNQTGFGKEAVLAEIARVCENAAAAEDEEEWIGEE